MSEGQTFKTSWWDLNRTCNTWFVSLACSEAGTLHTNRGAEVISVNLQDTISVDSHDEVFYINHRHGAVNREPGERVKSGWEHVDVSGCMTANQNKSLRTAQAWLAHMAARLGLLAVDTVWQSTGQTSNVQPSLSAQMEEKVTSRPHRFSTLPNGCRALQASQRHTRRQPCLRPRWSPRSNTYCQNICVLSWQ